MQCSASSSTLFPAIQTCTCFLTGQKKRFVKTPVHPSQEPGWLEGTLNGKTGLIPENYVEFL
ncbi:Rho GTPase-activating protein 26 [Tupaia chinensis]|uniref:Rho GTPase-activating protein 26 n=1 Tax=Tupaia chinensis TaxID=246437 RepID=L9L2W3_TUPCH|nr:Rho GTPase-activating protein 26 [Tupaia chinensis]